MASDLIQRAAAICGYPFTPHSDQLAAWLDRRADGLAVEHYFDGQHSHNWRVDYGTWREWHASLLECLAAVVVEVDRIEREAANAHQA